MTTIQEEFNHLLIKYKLGPIVSKDLSALLERACRERRDENSGKTGDRYFCFMYKYWSDNIEGNMSIHVVTENGRFPSMEDVKVIAQNFLAEKYGKDPQQYNPVVTNWIELDKSDYEDWTRK